tara:strand:+ start:743 stop:1417 length:675 start_codon:yes stop_codon:yes gene_type:complete
MKLIMENWKKYLAELDLTDPDLGYMAGATDTNDAVKRAQTVKDTYTHPNTIEAAMIAINFIPIGLAAGLLTKGAASAILKTIKHRNYADDLIRISNKIKSALGKSQKMRNAPLKDRNALTYEDVKAMRGLDKDTVFKSTLKKIEQSAAKPIEKKSKPLSPELQKKFDDAVDYVAGHAKTMDAPPSKGSIPAPLINVNKAVSKSRKTVKDKDTVISPPPIPRKTN